MTYRETLKYLYGQLPMYHRIGPAAYKANLDNTQAIDELLGHPHKAFRTIHIAGTNGKGSVAHMLASVLQHAGYRAGLYTSPHLKDFRERIRVNGKMIPRPYVTDFVSRHRRAFEKIAPSFFEWTVGLAFDYFRFMKPDVVVVETGLGGRLDSTNIITPVLSVITNVGLDHTALLGTTVKRIATEKAGIIKRGIPVVIGETQDDTREAFQKRAGTLRSPLVFADREYTVRLHRTGNSVLADLSRRRQPYLKNVRLDLTGIYQRKNVCTVMAALEELDAHFDIPEAAVRAGLATVQRTTGLQGRWQVINANPPAVCDAAHNAEGLTEVARQLKATPHRDLHIVLGLSSDKDATAMLALLPRTARYYFCRAAIPRAMDASRLAMLAATSGRAGDIYPSVKTAYRAALGRAGRRDLVFVGGSLFTIAEVL